MQQHRELASNKDISRQLAQELGMHWARMSMEKRAEFERAAASLRKSFIVFKRPLTESVSIGSQRGRTLAK